MPPVTNQMLNERREYGCVRITTERKHYNINGTWIKRSLRPSEWQTDPDAGTLIVPRYGEERLYHEALALTFVAAKTNIPVPKLHAFFADDGAVCIVMEKVQGVSMAELGPDARNVVAWQLDRYIETLQGLKHSFWGGLSRDGVAILPPGITAKLPARQEWKMSPRQTRDLVFCHNDLAPHNVIVNPATLKVEAILGWGYSGFYPAEFERRYYRRTWSSVPAYGELNDDRFVQIMVQNVAADAHEELAQEEQEHMLQNGGAGTFEEPAQIKAEPED